MRLDAVREGETPGALSARLGAPVCQILRRNRLICAAWLYPGREIAVPEPGFCERDAFPCPAALVDAPARETPYEAFVLCEGDTVSSVALALGVSERLARLALGRNPREGTRFLLEKAALDADTADALPGGDI